jgi:hypothetical protein
VEVAGAGEGRKERRMRVELVTTPSGRETVEINFGNRIEVLSHDEAQKLAQWINELLPPSVPPQPGVIGDEKG